eukprot:12573066-Alexandrium_andersonii.AAC.1
MEACEAERAGLHFILRAAQLCNPSHGLAPYWPWAVTASRESPARATTAEKETGGQGETGGDRHSTSAARVEG